MGRIVKRCVLRQLCAKILVCLEGARKKGRPPWLFVCCSARLELHSMLMSSRPQHHAREDSLYWVRSVQRWGVRVSDSTYQQPLLVDLYEQYLIDQDSATFVKDVAGRYSVATLQRLCEQGERAARRASVLALGFLADYGSNAVLGRALVDRDRGVRNLADNAIRNVWIRVGTAAQREKLQHVMQLNSAKQYYEAIRQATKLIHESPWFAEAWNQRALAHFNCGEFDESIRDCHQTLEINPYHFPAATGLGKCYLQLNNRSAALEAFRRAQRLNPGLDDVRAHVVFLQRALKEE